MKIQQSPVNDKFSAKLINEITSAQIAKDYKKNLGVDVSRFIHSQSLKKYRCEGTGLEFYRGINPGDGAFYSELMKFDWYYDPWKWEHEIVKRMLKSGDKLVEIGSGSGGFLKGIKDSGVVGKGIEINKEGLDIANKLGLDVTSDDLNAFSQKHANTFDWSVSFQVLEHIEDVEMFLLNSIKLLKPGGKLVISVPNNDSFIGRTYNLLNLPPHHMNRWTKESLRKIAPIFDLELDRFEYEPLQEYHYNWYINAILDSTKDVYSKRPPILKGLIYRSAKKILENWVKIESNNIIGHSILAIYTKK